MTEEKRCALYRHRPLTCRVYGIPTLIQGSPRVCGQSKFKKGEYYPVFNLDEVNRELYHLSKGMLEEMHDADKEKASLLVSLSRVLQVPLTVLVEESYR